MPPKRNPVPSYLLHKPSGEARAYYYDGDGKRRCVSLGVHGSPESKRRHRELLKRIEVREAEPAPKPVSRSVPSGRRPSTVAGLCLQFLDHAKGYYRRSDGTNTSEYDHYGCAIDVLIEPDEIAEMKPDDFGRSTLAQVREAMLAKGWTRQTINSQVRRVKSIFRWAEQQEYVSEGKWGSLQLLPSLKAGRTPGVPEQREILPVSDADIALTLPCLSPTVARMVRFHRLTACRPQDVCGLEWERIDRTGTVWLYSPKQHKGSHRGEVRIVRIGPAAQSILGVPGTGCVFSPQSAFAEVLAARRAGRKTKLYESHVKHIEAKRKLLPLRRPGLKFTTETYGDAIEKACDKAGITPHWTPNQLRHAALAEFRDRFGLDVAQAIAGHKNAKTTEIYASPSAEAARKAIEAVG